MDNSLLPLSSSVNAIIEKVGPDTFIDAATFADEAFKFHYDKYLNGSETSLQLRRSKNKRKANEWFADVQTLFDKSLVESFSNSSEKVMLHGRMLIIGLSLLDISLYQQIKASGAFDALVKESEEDYKLQKPLFEALTEYGRGLYQSLLQTNSQPDQVDSVNIWSDNALQKAENDLLGRAAYARFLSQRITFTQPDEGAYAIHLYGPWGAGKSTILNFVKHELETTVQENGDKWLVVEFNAWRHQHIDPPWWSLMESIFQRTKGNLRFWDRLQEYSWRFNTGRLIYLIPVIIMLWLFSFAISWVPTNIITAQVNQPLTFPVILAAVATTAKNSSDIIALILTVWGAVLAINRSLLFGSAKAAQDYKDRINDPMNDIKQRFTNLISSLRNNHYRVAVFIDDLDRCRSTYAVELLEGIQTLFRDAPVIYLIAADRHWLNACYEQVYEKFKPQIDRPGKPLGSLFLEKAFRFSTPLPGISKDLNRQYWQYLLNLKQDEQKADLEAARAKAQKLVWQARNESEVRKAVDDSQKITSFIERRAIREAAVERLATPEVMKPLEHTLQPYEVLLEKNPRSMKRLVNTYSSNLTLTFLSEVDVDRHQLVLWTILSFRWPQLAEYLEEHPEMLEKIIQQDAAAIPDELKPLLQEPEVLKVISGTDKELKDEENKLPKSNPLTQDTIEKCVQMHA